jgi:hypothetical protein
MPINNDVLTPQMHLQPTYTILHHADALVLRINATINLSLLTSDSRPERETHPYRPNTSAKINISTIPTYILDCCMNALTPYSGQFPAEFCKGLPTASPTVPIAYPAAKLDSPTDRPAARCKKALNSGYGLSGLMLPAINTDTTSAYTARIPAMTMGMSDFRAR